MFQAARGHAVHHGETSCFGEVCSATSPPCDQPASQHPSGRLSTGHQLVPSLELCLESRSTSLRQLCKALLHRRRHGHVAQNGAQLYQTPTVRAWMEERDRPWDWVPACSVCKRQRKVCECGTGWRSEPERQEPGLSTWKSVLSHCSLPQLQLSEILISSSNGY